MFQIRGMSSGEPRPGGGYFQHVGGVKEQVDAGYAGIARQPDLAGRPTELTAVDAGPRGPELPPIHLGHFISGRALVAWSQLCGDCSLRDQALRASALTNRSMSSSVL